VKQQVDIFPHLGEVMNVHVTRSGSAMAPALAPNGGKQPPVLLDMTKDSMIVITTGPCQLIVQQPCIQ
jgi:hypothetical protein